MANNFILLERHNPAIAHIVLNRPEKRNALNIPLLEELCAVLDLIQQDKDTRALILRGNGSIFCAGLDLTEAADDTRAHASAELIARMLKLTATQKCLTVAAVHGAAMAGGAGLMSACDIVLAAEGTLIGYPEVRRGLVAGLVMTFLRRRLKEADARELLLLAEPVVAPMAKSMGLVNHVVPQERLIPAAEELARMALKAAPDAIARTKVLLNELYPRSLDDDLQHALGLHKEVRTSAAAREGMLAFNEKRPPKWDPDAGNSPEL
jgi:methylglutaconyl-CoA hydratase